MGPSTENVLLKLNLSPGTGKRGHLIGVDVSRHVVSNVFRDLSGSVENLHAVHGDHCLNVIHLLVAVLWPAPRRGEEHDVGSGEIWNNLEKVSDDELNAVLDAVNPGIVPRLSDLFRVDIDGDDSLASPGKLEVNSIALLKYQRTFQQTFQQSFQYYRVYHTTIKTLLKTLLRFQQSY